MVLGTKGNTWCAMRTRIHTRPKLPSAIVDVLNAGVLRRLCTSLLSLRGDTTDVVATDPSLEDNNDFSETAKFISQILMEENVDQRPCYDSLTLQVTEKSFYDALTGSQPLSLNQHPLVHSNSNSSNNENSHSILQFMRGLEEATKYLPPGPNLVTAQQSKGEKSINKSGENSCRLKGRKNLECRGINTTEDEEERRSNKQSALSLVDESDLSDAFDRVLLLSLENVSNEQSYLQSEAGGGKSRSMKQGKKKETVDLRNLLLMCAQSVYANDNGTANELLKQIRHHSSPFGDASQRLAHYFANGLEAQLVGDGTGALGMASFLSSKRNNPAEFLKAQQIFLSASPFKKFTYFFANKMILEAAAKADTVHVIDFGILYGFQWPMRIKFLSNREGGPPKLRITGIDFPQPGFRPTERIEETGRRLANYCKRYNVPFEYNAIASRNWVTIQVEAFKIQNNELVAVNSLLRFENLLDETIEVNSPRNAVLHLIKKINLDIFTQSIVNGSYNSPYFTTRFREALFHFSSIYDQCDAVLPRENEWRVLIEREILGREAINVIACEGVERIQRPETYKQWQIRNTKAGFKQLQLKDEELLAIFRTQLRKWYHKDFVLDEDNNWMLLGWKGRILFASTCWVLA